MAASIAAEEAETEQAEPVMIETVTTEIGEIEIGEIVQAALRLSPIEFHSCSAANRWRENCLDFRSLADWSPLSCRTSLHRNYLNCDRIFDCHLKRSLMNRDLRIFHFSWVWTHLVLVPANPEMVVESPFRWTEKNPERSPYLVNWNSKKTSRELMNRQTASFQTANHQTVNHQTVNHPIAAYQVAAYQVAAYWVVNSAMASLLAAESRSHWMGFDFDSMGCFQIANCSGPNCSGPNYFGANYFGRCFRQIDHLGYLANSRNSIGYWRAGFVDHLD